MGTLIAVLSKKGKNSAKTAVTMLNAANKSRTESFGIASAANSQIEKTIDDLQTSDTNSHAIVGYAFAKILDSDKPQPIELESGALVFDGRIYPSARASDVEIAAKRLQGNHVEAAHDFIKKIEGDYAFALATPEGIIVGRDPLGLRSLYYGENVNVTAFASERKALWRIGIEETVPFPPGHIAVVDRNNFKFELVRAVAPSNPRKMTMQAASKKLRIILQRSTRERVSGLKRVAVAFSGGLDSSAIAFLAMNLKADVDLIHVSLQNQSETKHAKQVADRLKLPIHIFQYNRKDVEQAIPKVLWITEEANPVKMGIGIPVYWAAERAAEMGFKVMLAGQGADELFGGYRRYVDDYLLHGAKKAKQTILSDIINLHEASFERDSKICNNHNVELRLPFASYKMAKFAVDLPLELKIEPTTHTLRKLVLRQTAKELGLPQSVAERPKKAIQYTTGINNALRKIAKKNGLSLTEYLQNTFKTIYKKMMKNE